MRVIVAGAGNVGAFIVSQLAAAGHDLTVIEIDAERHASAQANGGAELARWVLGDACEPTVLESVDPTSADVLVAVTGDDEDNLVISLLAKQELSLIHI